MTRSAARRGMAPLLVSVLVFTAVTYAAISCDPLQTTCPANAALGGSNYYDFITDGGDAFEKSDNSTFGTDPSSGLEFIIWEEDDAPTLTLPQYIFFGRLEVTLKFARGTGIVTTLVLQSDCLDEIDIDLVGGEKSQLQSNYFGKGNTSSFDRGGYHNISDPSLQFHTYAVDWTSERIQWMVDGKTVRVLNYEDADSGRQFPQTPAQLKMGTWVAGKSNVPEGTVAWAGGLTNFDNAPFIAYLQSVRLIDYGGGTSEAQGIAEYSYRDQTGTFDSIDIKKAEANTTGTGTQTSTTSTPAPTSGSPVPPNQSSHGSGLGKGAIAGIVVGVVGGAITLGTTAFYCLRRRRPLETRILAQDPHKGGPQEMQGNPVSELDGRGMSGWMANLFRRKRADENIAELPAEVPPEPTRYELPGSG
ncbi:putative ice nucleation protein [Rosellinia necatrix]|uniref:Putative ice nucleation protein n=1 Tax=Rosellinia necatrix TaxID=77044 RepID=A0A1S7UHY5_ROSNE|nr:putative ice nucleation protein [Rosellinia necatrix]